MPPCAPKVDLGLIQAQVYLGRAGWSGALVEQQQHGHLHVAVLIAALTLQLA